jgi:thioester reductase-like protein
LMATFITGSTGYLGSYVVSNLLAHGDERLVLLVRAANTQDAQKKLWRALQLHMAFPRFREHLATRIKVVLGDITSPHLGMSDAIYERVAQETTSVIHIAASLNRKSAKTCMNVNLRGTLEVIELAQKAHQRNGLRRFSDVSTTAVAGERQSETVYEDAAIDWDRSDYDPYARTKKFCEHMLHKLLPDVPISVFRPSIVLGDSRFPQTTQFDMVRAFVMLARMPLLPLRPEWRMDIVPADYVGKAIATIHQKPDAAHGIYHLSSGKDSLTNAQIVGCLRLHGKKIAQRFAPALAQPFASLTNTLADTPKKYGVAGPASLLKVFWPYLTFDTVFDNARVVNELGEAPASFERYASPLLDFAVDNNLAYPYAPWPEGSAPEVDLLLA